MTDVDGPVAVVAGTDEVLRLPPAGTHLLNEAERGRLARFHRDAARRDFVAAHTLVRFCAGRLLGIAPAEVAFVQRCPTCHGTDHGRPLLADRPDVRLSLSHADGVVAAAAAHAPVGIDVERPGRDRGPALLRRVLTPAELALVDAHADPGRAFLRQWVRKEALVKTGRADVDSFGALDLSALALDGPGLGTPLPFEDLYVTDVTDSRRSALAAAVSTGPVRPHLQWPGVLGDLLAGPVL